MHSLNKFTIAATIVIFIFDIQRAFARPTNEELRGKYLQVFFSGNETATRNHSTWDPFPYIYSILDFAREKFENHTTRVRINDTTEIPTTITAISDKTESIENNTNIAGLFEAIVTFPTTSSAIISNNGTDSIFDDFTSLAVTIPSPTTGNVTILDKRSESSADNLTTTEMPKAVTFLGKKDLNQNKSTTDILGNETTTENTIATVVTIGDATTINKNATENLAAETLTAKSNVNSPSPTTATDRATTTTTGNSLWSVTINNGNASITAVKSDTAFTGITELIDNEAATEKSVVTGNATTIGNNETEFLAEDTTTEKSNLTSPSSINASQSDHETNLNINKTEAMGNTSITGITTVKLDSTVTLSYMGSTADETNTTKNVSSPLPLNNGHSKLDEDTSSSVESSESEEISPRSRLNSKFTRILI